MQITCDFVYINGAFVPHKDAKISVFDHSFLYGNAVFEGLQVVNGYVFRLQSHLERFFRSAHYLGIDIPMAIDELEQAILETARVNGLRDGYMRPIATRGAGSLGVRNMDSFEPNLVIIAQKEQPRAGLAEKKAIISSLRRIPPDCIDPRVKSCNYINNILSFVEARNAGADTVILLDQQGFVAEGYASNVVAIENGRLLTPSLGNILEGVTRDTILDLAREKGIPAEERRMTVYDFVCADEVLEIGTVIEIASIIDIGGRKIGRGTAGPVAQDLHRALRARMEAGWESSLINFQ